MSETRLPGVLVPAALAGFAASGGDLLAGDLVMRQGQVVGLAPATAEPSRIVMPRLADPHVHLDKCHTVGRIPHVGGDLMAAIAAQRQDRAGWTAQDIRARATRGLDELATAGCGAVRSHVDWGTVDDPAAVPLAWEVLGEVAEAYPLVLQRAALVSMPVMADAEHARRIAARMARDCGVLGCFVYDQPERAAGIANLFRLAQDFGLAVDVHVDEGLAPGLDGVERVADAALACGFEGPVLLGHACALMNRTGDALARVIDKLARAGIAVAALPYTNLYLQGRADGTPDRRGLTRIHELRAGGVRVVLGADNVRDAFCPVGNHNPLATLALGAVAGHLDPPFGRWLGMISTEARLAMGLEAVTVAGAAVQDLICFEATTLADLLSAPPRAVPLGDLLERLAA